MENIWQVLLTIQWLHVMKLLKEKQKQLQKNLLKKNTLCKTKNFCILLAS